MALGFEKSIIEMNDAAICPKGHEKKNQEEINAFNFVYMLHWVNNEIPNLGCGFKEITRIKDRHLGIVTAAMVLWGKTITETMKQKVNNSKGLSY